MRKVNTVRMQNNRQENRVYIIYYEIWKMHECEIKSRMSNLAREINRAGNEAPP